MNLSRKPTVHTQQLGFALPLVILIVVVLIAAGGAGYYFYKTSKAPAKEAEKIEKQLEKYLKERSENPSRETWEKLMLVKAELEDFLKELKDPQICEKFKASGERIHCLVSVAKNLKDHLVCEKISPESPSIVGRTQSDCYNGVAVVLKDYSICEKIISPSTKSSCYIEVAVAFGDPLECEKIPPANKDNCYRAMAADQLDFSICGRISEEEEYPEVPKEYLESITTTKNQCYLDIINQIEEPSEILLMCKELPNDSLKRMCYYRVIYKTKSADICKEIEQDFRDECYWEFVGGDVYVCGTKDQSVRDSCYFDLAEKHPELTPKYRQRICWYIRDKHLKQECENLFKEP